MSRRDRSGLVDLQENGETHTDPDAPTFAIDNEFWTKQESRSMPLGLRPVEPAARG